jgi:hypothetical protein
MAGLAMWAAARRPWRLEMRREAIAWALPILGLCLCVYIFKSEIRFRVPFDVWGIPLAVAGWLAVINQASPGVAGARLPASSQRD